MLDADTEDTAFTKRGTCAKHCAMNTPHDGATPHAGKIEVAGAKTSPSPNPPPPTTMAATKAMKAMKAMKAVQAMKKEAAAAPRLTQGQKEARVHLIAAQAKVKLQDMRAKEAMKKVAAPAAHKGTQKYKTKYTTWEDVYYLIDAYLDEVATMVTTARR